MNCPRCGKDIDEHEAGYCMDVWVAEVVMRLPPREHSFNYEEGNTPDGDDGWSGFYCSWCGLGETDPEEPCAHHYSTQITDAWTVAEKLDFEYHDLTIQNDCEDHTADKWFIKATHVKAKAPTVSLAICRAALKAIGGDNGRGAA